MYGIIFIIEWVLFIFIIIMYLNLRKIADKAGKFWKKTKRNK